MLSNVNHVKRVTPLLLVILVIGFLGQRQGGAAEAAPGGNSASPAGAYTVHLPLATKIQPARSSVFGAQISDGLVLATVPQAAQSNVSWARYGGVTWAAVENVPGNRNWGALANSDTELLSLVAYGAQPILTVTTAPAWAQAIQGQECGPIKPQSYTAFASFMHDLVQRYSAPPFNVRYFEVWNEPDAPKVPPAGTPQGWGCWGDSGDQYYGGGQFGAMLNAVYPQVKAANPAAVVVLGGLLLGCSSTPLPIGAGLGCPSGKFLDGILHAGAGQAFDMLAYHAYTAWNPARQDWDLSASGWAAAGGSLLGKLAFVKNALIQNHVPAKPIIMDEGALLYYGDTTTASATTYYADQANFLARLYVRSWANGIAGAVWYLLNGPGWHNAGLLDASQRPRPAYTTFKTLSTTLQGASFSRVLISGPTLEGYEFRNGSLAYRVYWTNDGSTAVLGLPAGTQSVYDLTTSAVIPAGTAVTVSFSPIMVIVSGP